MATATKSANRVKSGSPAAVIRYRPQGMTLRQFHKSDDFVRVLIGPLGSGKTFGAINELLQLIHNQVPDKNGERRSRWCVARNSFPDLQSSTIPDFRSVTDKLPFGKFSNGTPPKWVASYPRSDGTTVVTEVLFRSFDGEQDVKKARGMQLTGVWVDELAEFHKANWDMLVGRVGRYPPKAEVPKAHFRCLGTSNACSRDHWLAEMALMTNKPYQWWIGVQPGGVINQGGQWVENSNAENISNLPPGYYLKQLGGKRDSWIRQNLANEFVTHTDGRPIHPDFSEALHVAPVSYVPGLPLHVGMDFGRTPAAVILQQLPNGAWRCLKELVTVNMGTDKFGPLLVRVLNKEYPDATVEQFTGDPAGTAMGQASDDTPFDMLDAAGIYAEPADTNDPEVRYATLDRLLTQIIDGQPAFMVDPSCTTLVRGLAGEYQFRRMQVVGREEYRDKPDKGPASHVCEALHYGLMGAGEAEPLFHQESDDYEDLPRIDLRYFE